MLKMCKPMNASKLKEGKETVPRWHHEAKEFTFMGEKINGEQAVTRLGQYCMQDVEVERAIHKRVLKLSAYEHRVWCMDYRINQRGVLFDPVAVKAALDIRDIVVADLNRQMNEVTGGEVAACTNVGALKDWAADYGVVQDSLAKAEIEYLTGEDAFGNERYNLPREVRLAFDLRREAGRATSVAKLATIYGQSDEKGRVHNLFQYHGAGTGRFAGRSVQPHNFTRDLPPSAVVEDIMALVKTKNIEFLYILYGSPLTTISKLLRGFIVAGNNRSLIGGDYSNIEGRGIAWLAGEEWKVEAFRQCDANPDGPDIYELSYAKTFGKSPDTVMSGERQIGKVIELALGYQGGVGAFQTMAKAYGVTVSDGEADTAKFAWREAHPLIQQYWYDLQEAAMSAIKNPGKVFTAGAYGREAKFKVAGSFLWLLLPSGRALCYPYPRIDWTPVFGWVSNTDDGEAPPKRPAITYKTVPSAEEWKRGRIVDDVHNTKQWARVSTYGGKLAENITQALCRDLLVDAMLGLDDAGYKIVLHVHDEIIVEGIFTEKDRKKVEQIMNTVPPWAKSFPLVSKCWLNKRYIKA
jgi:DNA polymerase